MSTTSSGLDINAKYQKLAAEYAKLRNQVPVLKKAVVDEQTKNAALTEDLKEKEQIVRKTNVEIESLTFRNQQLTKRVEHLQTSIDQLSINNSKNQKSINKSKRIPHSVSEQVVSPNNHVDGDVLEEELQRKLMENEHLHKQIYEMQMSHESESQRLLERIRSMETDSSSIRQELSIIRNQHDAMVDELKLEKGRLEKSLLSVQSKLSDSATELEKYRTMCDFLDENNVSPVPQPEIIDNSQEQSINLISREDQYSPSISRPIGESEIDRLDVPTIDSQLIDQFVHFLIDLRPYLSDLANHTSNFHSYCEQRSKLYPCDSSLEELSPVSVQYGALLKEKSNFCRSISIAFDSLCDKCDHLAQHLNLHNDIKSIIDLFSTYNRFLSDLLPIFKKSIEEECLVSWCNQRLERENRSYLQMFENTIIVLSQFYDELLLFTHISSRDDCERFITSVSCSAESVTHSFHDLATAYSLKIAEEHQLPVATKKLKTTNECICSSLSLINSSWNDITKLLESRKNSLVVYFCDCLKLGPDYQSLIDRHKTYIETLARVIQEKPSLPTVPSSCSFQSIQTVLASPPTEFVDELQSQIREKQKLIADLEKEKEHWAFETELLKMKVDHSKKSGVEDSNAEKIDTLNFTKQYFGDKLAEMNVRLQTEESRSAHFQRESQNLINAVQVAHRQREKLQQELRQSSVELSNLKDELETVRQGYESQMKTLSEHLAQMNQKLTKQTDEIDMLKQALNEKSHKKGLFR